VSQAEQKLHQVSEGTLEEPVEPIAKIRIDAVLQRLQANKGIVNPGTYSGRHAVHNIAVGDRIDTDFTDDICRAFHQAYNLWIMTAQSIFVVVAPTLATLQGYGLPINFARWEA
jgi:hypothetical protein